MLINFLIRIQHEISIAIRPGINYPQKYLEHKKVSDEMKEYIQNLKLTFYVLSKNIKSNKSTRTAFDITGSSTALAGTVIATTATSPMSRISARYCPVSA